MAKGDIEDVIYSLEDALSAARPLSDDGVEAGNGKAAVLDAIAQIRRGEHSNAITTLEREFLPKWQSTQHCERDFIRATGVNPTERAVGREIEKAIA